VVASGALQVVPFAALPAPARDGEATLAEPRPLVLDHEIVSLPSVSVLAALRSQAGSRRRPGRLLAVLADPVLERAEPPLRPLPHARREAEALLELAGGEPVLAAFGVDAQRELVLSGRLGDFRVLHFATHGIFDDLHPELSAIALSAIDPSGRPLDGRLRAYEIFGLDLRAELVVLSACRTALGEEVRGEGLVGLTQGFLHAGAERVLVSLWNVSDRATSELMQRFYAGLLLHRLSPARALREAQASMAQEGRWRAPYYWAGFVLQGEWR
jgi:CHAT domain-containing protein